jgi:hypothetical protein
MLYNPAATPRRLHRSRLGFGSATVTQEVVVKTFGLVIVLLVLAAPLRAQWLNHPTPGIPRTPDGKANLTAPAPRTADGKPDLSGMWQRISPKYRRNIAADYKPED